MRDSKGFCISQNSRWLETGSVATHAGWVWEGRLDPLEHLSRSFNHFEFGLESNK